MNKGKIWLRTKWIIWSVVAVLVACGIITTNVPSYASAPQSAYINYLSPPNNHRIEYHNKGRRNAANKNDKLVNTGQYLIVPGNNQSYVHLGFRNASGQEHSGMLVKAGPAGVPSKFLFPCNGGPSFDIAWLPTNGGRGDCKGYTKGTQNTLLPDSTNQTASINKSVLKAQASSNEVTVSPATEKPTLAQIRGSETRIEVYTLQGNLLAKSTKYPAGRVIPEGKKYTYPQDTIEDAA